MSRMQSFRFTLGLVAAAMIPACAFDGMDTSHEDVELAVEASEALTEYDDFKLDFKNVDSDVYVFVSQQLDDGEGAPNDEEQVFYSANVDPLPVTVNDWWNGASSFMNIRIVLGNFNCFESSLDMKVLKNGVPVHTRGYHPWGWQHCGYQLEWKYLFFPHTGVWMSV